MSRAGLVQRRLLQIALDRMVEEPVLLLQGPRTVGKSTLLGAVAARHGVAVLDLDDLATRDAVRSDPATFLAGPAPMCVDEYQHAPLVLDAIKAELNRDGRPGRFVLTGSARHESLPAAAQALTGRLHRLPVYPLSQAEIDATTVSLVEQLFGDVEGTIRSRGSSDTTREEYIDRIVVGGFPIALHRSPTARARWFDDYLRLTLERDVRELSRVQQATVLPKLLTRLAAQTGQVLNLTRAAAGVGLNERTADNYLRLLEAVFLLHRLPAWGTTLTARSAASPKIHLLDSGVAARLLRLTSDKLARRHPTALTELGHLLETFVVGQLITHASWTEDTATIGHWRTRDGDEVDLVIERDDGTVLAVEVKAAARVAGTDFTALRKLRDILGDAFHAGIVIYLGARSYSYADRLHVLTADRLWT